MLGRWRKLKISFCKRLFSCINRVGIKKKSSFLKKLDNQNVLCCARRVSMISIWSWKDVKKTTFLWILVKNYFSQACEFKADYFKVVIFQEKQFEKDGSFINFWFLGSKNWFVIHESWGLNSNSDKSLVT